MVTRQEMDPKSCAIVRSTFNVEIESFHGVISGRKPIKKLRENCVVIVGKLLGYKRNGTLREVVIQEIRPQSGNSNHLARRLFP